MTKSESLIIGYDESKGRDNTVLIVGRKKKGQEVEVINAFQGEEAYWMYQKLTTKKVKVMDNVAVEEKETEVR